MAPLVTLFEGNTVGRLNRDGNVTETAPFTWENVTTAYIALFSSSAGSNAVCRAVQAKGGVGTLALAETYGSTDYDDGLDIFSQLLAASGTYSNFSAAEVLGGVVEKVEETGSGRTRHSRSPSSATPPTSSSRGGTRSRSGGTARSTARCSSS